MYDRNTQEHYASDATEDMTGTLSGILTEPHDYIEELESELDDANDIMEELESEIEDLKEQLADKQ